MWRRRRGSSTTGIGWRGGTQVGFEHLAGNSQFRHVVDVAAPASAFRRCWFIFIYFIFFFSFQFRWEDSSAALFDYILPWLAGTLLRIFFKDLKGFLFIIIIFFLVCHCFKDSWGFLGICCLFKMTKMRLFLKFILVVVFSSWVVATSTINRRAMKIDTTKKPISGN